MKTLAISFLLLTTTLAASASEVSKFNKVLLEDVQKDIKSDNDDSFRTHVGPLRGPASVEPVEESTVEPEPKIDKTVRQLGTQKW